MLTSCTKTIVERVECTNWKIVDIDVPERSWGWQDGFYVASVNVPELTKFVFTDGFVECFEVNGDYQMVLPYTRYMQESDGYCWEYTVDYEFSEGRVDFYFSTSDFVEYLPGSKRFRMVLHW